MKKVIITIVGPDRAGIIASFSEILFRKGCNIENISQTTLQSEFAGICVAAVPDEVSLPDLGADLNRVLAHMNLQVHIKSLEKEISPPDGPSMEHFIVTSSGPDKKGLVAMISRVIADSNINISNLKAVFKGGTDAERNIMIYEIEVPAGTDMNRFSQDLKKKALENSLELSIQHKNIFDAVNRI